MFKKSTTLLRVKLKPYPTLGARDVDKVFHFGNDGPTVRQLNNTVKVVKIHSVSQSNKLTTLYDFATRL